MAIEQQDFTIKQKNKINQFMDELKQLKEFVLNCEKYNNCNEKIYNDTKNRIKLLEKVTTTTQWYL